MNPIAVIAVVAALSLVSPQVGDVVFKWIPATISVITGVDVPGDVRVADTEQAPPPEAHVQLALKPVEPARGFGSALFAQAASAFDAAANPNTAYVQPLPTPADDASRVWRVLVPISIFFSLVLIVGIIYSILQLMRIREAEQAALSIEERPIEEGAVSKAQLRFQRIVEHANTESENDWRHAIIEADIMLDELLTVQGYRGDTLGDKLKQVERSDFNTIDLAWEAHKVRNRIAHEGSAHSLNAREVRRVIALYEQVLREFHYI